MLASNFRISTRDVDAVAEDQQTIDRLAEIVAQRRDWPTDWLNDGVRTYLSPRVDGVGAHHSLFRAYPSDSKVGLRVFVPSAAYMLAMKLIAMRLDAFGGKSDLDDILSLWEIVGLKTPEEALAFVSDFYPEARVSGRTVLGLRELWRHKQEHERRDPHAPPRYLGRGRNKT